MAQSHRTVVLNGRELSATEVSHLDSARESARWVRIQRDALERHYDKPDSEETGAEPSGVWPMAFHYEGSRPSAEKYSLVWLIGNRVVLEEFSPVQGKRGEGWFRYLLDYDTETGDLVRSMESNEGLTPTIRTNPLLEVEGESNVPGVYLRQLEDALSVIALGMHGVFSDVPKPIAI